MNSMTMFLKRPGRMKASFLRAVSGGNRRPLLLELPLPKQPKPKCVRLPLTDEQRVKDAILEAAWPVVAEDVVGQMRWTKTRWKKCNARAAETLARNGYTPQAVKELPIARREDKRLRAYRSVMLKNLMDDARERGCEQS